MGGERDDARVEERESYLLDASFWAFSAASRSFSTTFLQDNRALKEENNHWNTDTSDTDRSSSLSLAKNKAQQCGLSLKCTVWAYKAGSLLIQKQVHVPIQYAESIFVHFISFLKYFAFVFVSADILTHTQAPKLVSHIGKCEMKSRFSTKHTHASTERYTKYQTKAPN